MVRATMWIVQASARQLQQGQRYPTRYPTDSQTSIILLYLNCIVFINNRLCRRNSNKWCIKAELLNRVDIDFVIRSMIYPRLFIECDVME